MNKEDYVSLEVAKLLKEKGFDECCGAYYHCNWDEMTEEECFEVAPIHVFRNSNNRYRIGAPTLYEAQKWLRTSYKILITPCYTGKGKYNYFVTRMEADSYYCNNCDEYNSYEDALNAGILEALKFI